MRAEWPSGRFGDRPYNGAVTFDRAPIVLYGRPGCDLCAEASAMLDALLADRAARGLPAPSVAARSIDGDDELQRRYLLAIPVVAVGGRELELVTSRAKLRRFLSEALDGGAGAVAAAPAASAGTARA